MGVVGQLAGLLRAQRFRQLYGVRLTSQFSDGLYQVALASYVLFDPQDKPTATAIAAGLAALLLPFCALGPFVGVFLDRWSRRQVLAVSNLLRLVPVAGSAALVAAGDRGPALFVVVLAALSVNRFFLAGLSASLPHVVDGDDLVLANSITPTSGTILFTLGVGAGALVRPILPFGDHDAVLTAISGLGYLAAALLAFRLPRALLGPDLDAEQPQVREALHRVVRGLAAALRHLRERRGAAAALGVVTVHRFLFGLVTVVTVLLYRNTFYRPHQTGRALAGLATAVSLSGAGFFAAVVVTPFVTRRLAPRGWILVLLAVGAVPVVLPGELFTPWATLVAAFAVGFSAQGVKICVDTLVQTGVHDAFRGRVFALYDVLFNAAFVAAAGAGAVVIPSSGRSPTLLAVIAAAFLATAVAYRLIGRTVASAELRESTADW